MKAGLWEQRTVEEIAARITACAAARSVGSDSEVSITVGWNHIHQYPQAKS
jgi:hypothetical protein